ncbi:MAG: 2'-5' RNA ligase family protein [Chloroflexota bacterium]
MTTADAASGVVARVSLPPALETIRRRHDRAAASGAPAHVTLLFPFMPMTRLGPTVRRDLAKIAAAVPAFDVAFARVGRFPGAIYLVPDPSAPFEALTTAIVARYPAFPPYEGAFAEIIPHLTLVESATAPLDAIAKSAVRHLPFERHVAAIELLAESGDGRWHSHWRIPLKVRP